MKIKKRKNAMEKSSLKEVYKKILRDIFFSNSCSCCSSSLDRNGFLCMDCLKKLLSESYLKNVDNFYYVFYYDENIREIIADYKLRNRKALGEDLAFLIRKPLEQLIKEEKIDAIIPIPINEKRLKERGFNQVEYILDLLKINYSK